MGIKYPAAIHFHFGQRQPNRRIGMRHNRAVKRPASPGEHIRPDTSGQWPCILYFASSTHQGALRRTVALRKTESPAGAQIVCSAASVHLSPFIIWQE